jgi:hypothetical protein
MPLHGHIHNGVVILDDPTSLPDGTLVSVKPLPQPAPTSHPRGPAAAILEGLRRLGPFQGDPEEWNRLLEDLRRSKQEALPLELEREKLNGELP